MRKIVLLFAALFLVTSLGCRTVTGTSQSRWDQRDSKFGHPHSQHHDRSGPSFHSHKKHHEGVEGQSGKEERHTQRD